MIPLKNMLKACNCSTFGSLRTDCEQSTGKCLCKPGYSGPQCQICPNGEHVASYGYHVKKNGKRCVNDLNCKYGGKCKKVGQNIECVCPASCVESSVSSLSAVCASNGLTYSSECHLAQFSCRSQVDITLQHYGPCVNNSDAGGSVGFDGTYYLKYVSKLMDDEERKLSSIQIEFSTDSPNGVIFFEGESFSPASSFILIGIRRSKLVVMFNLGSNRADDLPLMTSSSDVSDQQWHLLTLRRDERQMKMVLDFDEPIVAYSRPGANSFHSSGFFYLGGAEKRMKGLPRSLSAALKGCLRNVQINKNVINLREDRINVDTELKKCHDAL
ncbi:hypothetical protein HELRODRAFT_169094 [Helobdella robusta]|uniref:Laminin G domain-containing protein n=1 Tax=Helobdella robusta TaxID=6412 RepID=T1F1D9_HELRO|nr:hypothetical protein HELRODRAFT_169094 [Helobdella robusta]ESO09150.1 hypothetical protein HELRODRAFT_169094 [Helobdella robusta]